MAHNNGYVSVNLIGSEVEEIFGALLEAGVSLPKYSLHCTLMYDEDVTEPLAELQPEALFHAHVTSLDILGDGLVFHLTSSELAAEHRRLKEAGYKHSFDAFLPHMSITYDFTDYEVLKMKQVLAGWGGRQLTFSGEGYGTKGFD